MNNNILYILLFFLTLSCCYKAGKCDYRVSNERSNERIVTDRLNSEAVEMDDNLVKIDPKEYGIKIDIRYAKDNNFTCTTKGLKCYKGYKKEFLYLHKDAAWRLKLASNIAKKLGYTLIVWDAWRPIEAQDNYFQFVGNEDYFSSGKGLAVHTRGIAIDLGLIDKTGKVLDFGTDFDSFFDKSNHFVFDKKKNEYRLHSELTKKQLENRITLAGIMNIVGLSSLYSEWWHYFLKDPNLGIHKYSKYKAGRFKDDFVNDVPDGSSEEPAKKKS